MPTSYRLPDDIQAKITQLAKKHFRSTNNEVVYALSLYIQRCEDEEASEHEYEMKDGSEQVSREDYSDPIAEQSERSAMEKEIRDPQSYVQGFRFKWVDDKEEKR